MSHAANGAKALGGLLVGALLSACAVGPDYQTPALNLPDGWLEAPSSTDAPSAAGWRAFGDAQLDALLVTAEHANLDYQQTLDRIRQARSAYDSAFAAGLPQFSAHSSITRRRNTFGAIGGGSAGNTPIGGGFGGQGISNIFQAAFDVAWEIDLFGAVRRGVEAAEAGIAAEQAQRDAVRLSLRAEVARVYLEWRRALNQQSITQAQRRSQADSLALVQARVTAGLAAALDEARAEQALARIDAQQPADAQAVQLAEHALAVLLGQTPAELAAHLNTQGELPTVRAPLPSVLPVSALQRRPDVRRAERQLAAASADIGVAMAERYPRLNLTALLGLQNLNLAQLTPVGKSWSLAANATLPIFNWGRIRANIASKEARRDELRHAYESTLLTALREVEDASSACREEQLRYAGLQHVRTAAQRALVLANDRYQHGLADFLDVLDAQRTVYDADTQVLHSQAQNAWNQIDLYKALGGDWTQAELEP